MACEPQDWQAGLERGWLLLKQNRPEEAIPCLRGCVRAEPRHAQARFLLGAAYHLGGHLDEALESFGKALELDPGHGDAAKARSGILAHRGQLTEALEVLRSAIAGHPADPSLHTALGIVLERAGDSHAALEAYGAALNAAGDWHDALQNRGALLSRLGRWAEALGDIDRLLGQAPGRPEAHFNRGDVLLALGRYREGLESFQRALDFRPDYARAMVGRALALAALGQIEASTVALAEARSMDPQVLERFRNPLNGDDGTFDPRLIHLTLGYKRQERCDWSDRRELVRRFDAWVQEGIAQGRPLSDWRLSFATLSLPLKPDTRIALARDCGTALARSVPAPAPWRDNPAAKLRIGYLSPNFRNHPSALLTAPLYELQDRSRFEVFGYALSPEDGSAIRGRIARACDRFLDLSAEPDDAVAARIREDGVQILVDLAGYQSGARPAILAHRPAPLQVEYLGYAATMGAPFMDYCVVDAVAVPPEHRDQWTEALAYLPCSFFLYNDSQSRAELLSRGEYGLPEQGFVFCCFNAGYKIEPTVFAIWMRLLRRVEGSVLWLMASNEAMVGHLRREAAARGIDPRRLVFGPRLPLEAHLARHGAADLFLDTLWCNAHTTAQDALWSGLPVLTCAGTTCAGRIAASLLTAAGAPELITDSLEQYEERAYELAVEPGRLAALAERLRTRAGSPPLFDIPRTVRNLERAYETMWERREAGLPPVTFEVPVQP